MLNCKLINEWHFEQNGNLSPDQFSPFSQKKVWWKCSVCSWDWTATIAKRSQGRGCPQCAGQVVNETNNLAKVNPTLAEEWHTSRNKDLTPSQVFANSGKRVWWICKECHHEWLATINNRNSGTGCPVCKGNIATPVNNLAVKYPNLALEWHPSKNRNLSPHDVKPGSGKKVWWLCTQCNNEWKAVIGNRVKNGSGCKRCNAIHQSSLPEQLIFYYIKQVFESAVNREMVNGMELDIFIPDIKLAIEYDGYFFHLEKSIQDEDKNLKLFRNNIFLIRIREKGLPEIKTHNAILIGTKKDYTNKSLKEMLCDLFGVIRTHFNLTEKEIETMDALLSEDIQIKRQIVQQILKSIVADSSLAEQNPKLAQEWHPTRNGDLSPYQVLPNSHRIVWWLCQKCKYEWPATIDKRTNRRGCPFCAGKIVTPTNNLAAINPELAKEWHPDNPFGPEDILPNSHRKVLWGCFACGHEWNATVYSRNKGGNGCPSCSGKTATDKNNLAVKNPVLANQWHAFKNYPLTPDQVTPHSGKKVWWVCSECNHEWLATVDKRSNGRGCPKCNKQRYTKA